MTALISISVITPRPGRFDEFMDLQLAQLSRLRGKVPGVSGSRLFRSLDGRSVVMVSMFESAEAQKRFVDSPDLKDHLDNVRPLVEPGAPMLCETAYEFGQV